MKKIVVVGGGTMGLDIAHTFARSGHAVVVREISDELAEKSHSRLVAALDKLVARGKMDEAKRAEILGNMTFTTDLAAAADADLVLEAIVENLDCSRSWTASARQTPSLPPTPPPSPSPPSPPPPSGPTASSGCTSSIPPL